MKGTNMTSGNAIPYRRTRKLQGGGNPKLQYFTDVANSHTRPLPNGPSPTRLPADVPGDGVQHGQAQEEENG